METEALRLGLLGAAVESCDCCACFCSCTCAFALLSRMLCHRKFSSLASVWLNWRLRRLYFLRFFARELRLLHECLALFLTTVDLGVMGDLALSLMRMILTVLVYCCTVSVFY